MSKNPHFRDIHVPAHALGLFALVAAFNTGAWEAIPVFLVLNAWISGLGISVGFHRYFTHKAFVANRFWRFMMLLGGSLACQGSVIFWVALHRLHHSASDLEADIHSPAYNGFWSAYMGWIPNLDPSKVSLGRATDLIRDPQARFFHRHYRTIIWTYWTTLLLLGMVFESTRPFVYGALIAGMWGIHQEAIVNSMCHSPKFGIARFQTNDRSRDVPILSWFTWGQTLHNAHHAYPASANFKIGDSKGVDPGFALIRVIGTVR